MNIQHQPKHWNTDSWSEHWSSCYNQMSCCKLLSPGIYVDISLSSIIHPNMVADQVHPLMAAALLVGSGPPAGQCTCNTAGKAQEWSDEPDKELKVLNWPLNSSDPRPVDHLWDVPEPTPIHVGAPMDRSCLMVHPMDVQLVWDLGNSEARLTLWALCHVPRVVPEHFLQWCSCILLLGGHCHWAVSLSGAAALGLQRCLGERCFSKRRPCERLDSSFPSRTWHCHKMSKVIYFTCHWFLSCGR